MAAADADRVSRVQPVSLLMAGLLMGTPAAAQSGPDAGATREIAPGSAEPTRATSSVVIVLVGSTGHDPKFLAPLSELLGARGANLRFIRQPALRTTDVVDGSPSDSAVWVFISLRERQLLDLYFRHPNGERFLVRHIPLPAGLDAVGRELTAQVVESSVVALQQTDTGMSRQEARTALVEAAATDAGDRVHATPRTSREPRALHRRSTPPSIPPHLWLGARYGGAWVGDDVGPSHGLAVEIGIGWGENPFGRVRVLGEQGFAQPIDTPQVRARLVGQSVSLLPEVGWAITKQQAIVVGIGPGLDVTRVQGITARDSAVTLAPARTNWVPTVQAEVRHEFRARRLVLAHSAFATVPLFDTHYDIDQAGGSKRVAEPNAAIPGIAFTLAWTAPLRREASR